MPLIILLLVLGLPILELAILIDVGAEIGAISTVLLCLLTAATGLYLVRLQGVRVISRMQSASTSDAPVAATLVHGFFLLIAGFSLLVPGFVTDLIGTLLLIPPLRLFLGRAWLRRNAGHGGQAGMYRKTIIIEGEYEDSDKPDDDLKALRDRIEARNKKKEEQNRGN